MKINRIVVLVELVGGEVHQVLTTDEQKASALSMLRNEKGTLTLLDKVEPFSFESLKPEGTK
jgi:hypothetical protein